MISIKILCITTLSGFGIYLELTWIHSALFWNIVVVNQTFSLGRLMKDWCVASVLIGLFSIFNAGKDLDAVLKATPNLPEKEAKIVIVQIVRGLVYLNKRPQKIIHYDLKPGNVLFDEFRVAKVTDFGLSKIVEDNAGTQGMELTSQGAGTYW